MLSENQVDALLNDLRKLDPAYSVTAGHTVQHVIDIVVKLNRERGDATREAVVLKAVREAATIEAAQRRRTVLGFGERAARIALELVDAACARVRRETIA